MDENFSVLVVEDEPDLRDAVVEYLSDMGVHTRGVGDGRAMREEIARQPPTVVILDIALPGEDGLSLCRWVRRETSAGVIMATAAGQPLDRVVGLEIGADDYLVKPYELRELLARVRSLARRLERSAAPVAAPAPAAVHTRDEDERLSFGAFRLDRKARRLLDSSDSEVKLTATEYAMVLYFAERPGRIVTRNDLAMHLQGKPHDPDDRSIDISITRLRKKIETDPALPQVIRTIRGEGYRLD